RMNPAVLHSPTARSLDHAACEAFLIFEARLLDEGRFDDWVSLFTPDAHYWVPSEPGQPNPTDTVSLMFDDRRLLETRVRQLSSPRFYSQEPRSRTSRTISNVTIEEHSVSTATVRSKFMIVEYRREEQRIFAGTYWHDLVLKGDDIRISFKRVDLVN